ncbi:MAG: hypothetical protein JJ920_06195 [Roseitalea sp.]|nr:hypothetical protein [Roseitalea sp.]MBO6723456.1 hypothetical protein [Roseitalea sp.]MBO6742480.1 hypothetical protein [Roseitalea sp.]
MTNDHPLDQIANRRGCVGIVRRNTGIERLRQVLHIALIPSNRRGMQRHDRVFRLLLGKSRCQTLLVRFKRLELRPGNLHGHGLVFERFPQLRDATFDLCQRVLNPRSSVALVGLQSQALRLICPDELGQQFRALQVLLQTIEDRRFDAVQIMDLGVVAGASLPAC